MSASLKVALFGGVFAMCAVLATGPGWAQGSDQTASSATTTPASASSTLSAADQAALKADPNCQPAEVACSWSHCYPLASKWRSYSACIADNCHVKQQSCVQDLVEDLYDPVREKAMGAH